MHQAGLHPGWWADPSSPGYYRIDTVNERICIQGRYPTIVHSYVIFAFRNAISQIYNVKQHDLDIFKIQP